MPLSQAMLPEFDAEFGNTRKTIERVPDDRLAWKPHPKSFSMGDLAIHLAEAPGWGMAILGQDSFDVAPPGGASYVPPKLGSRKEILEIFDKNLSQLRAALAGTSDEQFLKPWSLLKGGQTVMTMPRLAVFRTFVMNHNIHHRAQLGVYLRLNDLPVPALYGPSADEGAM